MIVYLVRHRGRHYIARPGAVKPGPDEDDTLCWCERDGSVICFSGEQDSAVALPDEEYEK